jgi:hypothetical protein
MLVPENKSNIYRKNYWFSLIHQSEGVYFKFCKGDTFFLITGYAISFVGFLKMVLENLLKFG